MIKGYSCDWLLMDMADYSKAGAVRHLLYMINELYTMAASGNSTAMAVYLDITDAIRTKGVLTFKQKKYLLLWVDGFSYEEIGMMHRRDPWGINLTIRLAIKNISVFLCKK